MKIKKAAIITLIPAIVLIIFVFYGIYGGARKQDNKDMGALINNSLVQRFEKGPSELKEQANPINKISDYKGEFLALDNSGNSLFYYEPASGKLYSLLLHDDTNILSEIAVIRPNALNIEWSRNKKSIIAEYGDETKYYNLENGTSQAFAPQIKNPVFAPDGKNITYTYFNEKTQTGNISIADPSMESYKNLLPTRNGDWQIAWINDRDIALTSPSTASKNSSLLILDSVSGGLKTLIKSKKNLETLWSPNGNALIYSSLNPRSQKIELRYMDASSENSVNLKISTLASKCAWASDNKLFCAVPKTGLMKDNMYKISQDNITAITLSARTAAETLETSSLDIRDMVFSKAYNKLLFRDGSDGQLYQYRIPNVKVQP